MEKSTKILIGVAMLAIAVVATYFVLHKKVAATSANTTASQGANSTGGAQPLTIQSAQYYWPGDATSSAASKDVTGILQGLISNNQLDLNSSHTVHYYNQIFGDPSVGHGPKTLRVNYSIGGKTAQVESPEDAELKLNM